MFVHDFVAVPLPVDETVLSFTTCVPAHVMAELVRSAWNADAPILVSASTSSLQEISAHTVNLELSLALWERGTALADICQAHLDGARERIEAARPGLTSRPPAAD